MDAIIVKKIQKYLGNIDTSSKRECNAAKKAMEAFFAENEGNKAPKGKQGRKKAMSHEFSVGDKVKFAYKGDTHRGSVVKENASYAVVKVSGDEWQVPWHRLEAR